MDPTLIAAVLAFVAIGGVGFAFTGQNQPATAQKRVKAVSSAKPVDRRKQAVDVATLKRKQTTQEALKDLAAVLDEKNRKNLGPSELSAALTAKGWINFARDRAGEARSAFDEAVKVDGRNVSALVGQGEVLYADGRYTDASSRFGEALSKDANSIPALLGSAKSKIVSKLRK